MHTSIKPWEKEKEKHNQWLIGSICRVQQREWHSHAGLIELNQEIE